MLCDNQDEIKALKEQMASRQDVSAPPPDDHAPSLEIVQKELAAHKEMVAELRKQLEEKEMEFQVTDHTHQPHPSSLWE